MALRYLIDMHMDSAMCSPAHAEVVHHAHVSLPAEWLPYNEIAPIESGQAHVFPVLRQRGDSAVYALKRLKNPARTDRFMREVASMRALASQGVPVPDVIEQDVVTRRGGPTSSCRGTRTVHLSIGRPRTMTYRRGSRCAF